MLLAPDLPTVVLSRRLVVMLLIATIPVVALVAWTAKLDSFPDEKLHVVTASYYDDHWLPPAMDGDLTPYVGVHGVSYFMLWPPQAAYLVFAKAAHLVGADDDARWRAYRVMSALLWAGLVLTVLRFLRRAPWVVLLVGLTPQVWYVFTYFSADAFSYGMTAMIVLLLGVPDSPARRFLATGKPMGGGLALGACFGGLALSKMNFMPFALFAVVYALVLAWRMRKTGGMARRALVVATTGFIVSGPFLAADVARNGLGRDQRFETLRETYAAPGFKPSDIAAGRAYQGLALRERGVSLAAMFSRPWRWGLFTYRSFFGVYGTMNIFSPPGVNGVQRLVCLALVALAFLTRRRPWTTDQKLLLVTAMVLVLVTLWAAFWRAWTFDFQAQGRYVFAIIPITTLALLDLCEPRESTAHWALSAVLSVVGLISILSALPQLA